MIPKKRVMCEACGGEGTLEVEDVEPNAECKNCGEPFRAHCQTCSNHHYDGDKFIPARCEGFEI